MGGTTTANQYIFDFRRLVFVNGPFLADGCEIGYHMLDHHLFAFEAANTGRPTALGNVFDLVLCAVNLVQLKGWTFFRLSRVGALHSCRIGRHATELLVDFLGSIGEENRIVVTLAHLAAV